MGQQDAVLNVGAALVQGTQQAFAAIAKGFASVSKGMSTQAKAMRALGDSAGAAKFDKFAKSMSKATDEINEQRGVLDKLEKGYEGAAVAGDKLTASTEKQIRALAKQATEAKKAASVKGGTSGQTAILNATAVQKQTTLIEHLNLSYKELIHSTEVYGLEAKKVMAQLADDKVDPKWAADEIMSLDARRTRYQKLSVELQHLTSLYPKHALALANTNKSYLEQVTALNKLKAGRERLAAGDIKRWENTAKLAAANEKERVQIAMLIKSYQALFNSKTKFGASAQKIVATLNKEGVTLAQVKQGVRLLNKEFRTAQGQTDKAYLAFEKLSTSLKKLTVLYPKETAALVKLNKSRRDQLTVLSRLHKARQSLAAGDLKAVTAIPALERKIQSLIGKYDKLANTQSKYGKRAKQIQAILAKDPGYYDRASKSLHKLQQRQDRLLRSMTPLQQGIQRLGKSFKTYLSYMAASSVIFATLQIFREATTTVIEYDQALKDLQAITQSTDEDVAAMGETIKQVASDTKFSAVETAEGMKLLGQSGLSAKEAIDTIGTVANLATGTLTDMDTTVDLVTTSMRVFGIEAENSARISDVWANAVNRSKLTIDKIRTAMNYIGPVAAAVGISIEEVAGSMMIMANQGIRASTIGTGLRQVFRRLVDPSTEMKNALAEANLTMEDMDPNVVGLQKVFDNLKLIVTDSGDAFRMFGQRGATAVLAITKGGGAALLEMLSIVHRTGTAADMAATQMEGLGVSFKNLQDKIKNLYIAMGDNGLNGVLRAFVDTARSVVDVLSGVFGNAITQWISKILLATTAAHGFIAALKWFVGLKGVKALFAPWIAGFTAFSVAGKGAAASMTLFSRVLVGVRALLMRFLPAALLIGLVAFINHLAGANERLAEQGRVLRQHRNDVNNNVFALKSAVSILKEYEGSLTANSDVIQKLIEKYPELSVEILASVGDREKLVAIINKQIEAEEDLANTDSFTLLENQARDTVKAMRDLVNAEESPIYEFFFPAEMAKKAEAAKKTIKKNVGEMLREYTALLKNMPMLSFESFVYAKTGGEGELADELIMELEAQFARIEKIAAEKGIDVSEVFSKGLVDSFADRKSDWESFNKAEETALAKKLYKFEQLRALDKLSEEQTLDAVNRATLESYDERLRQARIYQEKAADDGNVEAMDFFHTKAEERTKKSYDIRLTQLQEFGKKRKKLEDKLAAESGKKDSAVTDYEKAITKDRKDQEKLRSDHTKTVGDKRKEIEKQVADKIKDINKTLYDKLEELRKTRIEREKETLRDLEGIEQSGDDKILSIRQRGMTDKQKELSNAQAAEQRYYSAQAALSKAKRTRDLEDVAVAQELYESASGYYESLENAGRAESGVRRITTALQEARKLQDELDKEGEGKEAVAAEKEAAAKRTAVRTAAAAELVAFKKDETEKLNIALNGINTVAAARKKEHDIVMAAHREEIELLKKKIEIEKSRQVGSVSVLPPGEEKVYLPNGGYEQTGFDQTQFTADLEKSIEASMGGAVPELTGYFEDASAAGIKAGTKKSAKGSDSSIKEGVKQQVAAGVQEGIFDGVKVEGVSLEEWKAKGKEQGAALGSALAEETKNQFEIIEIFDGDKQSVPVEVELIGVDPADKQTLVDDIQAALDEYPGEAQIDTTQADAAIRAFVENANRNYQITIPVQTKADGGAVVAMASGGRLPGQDSPEDKVHVMARPGEWFIKNEAVKSWSNSVGDWFMKGVNWPNSDAGKRLHELLDLNGSIMTQNRGIKKLAAGAVQNQGSSDMKEFGTVNFKLSPDEPPIQAAMRPTDMGEMMRQLNKMGRLAA